jgi:prepilin-type N-terminal cleavage/methylation domain-containing protein
MNKNITKAFTLIEILIVISIIGILTSLAVVSYTASQKQARDLQRKSDLSQYRTSLENYANTNDSLYPIYEVKTTASTLCGASILNISSCPDDPKTPDHVYYYISNSSGTTYLLWSDSETKSGQSWVVCSSGKSGFVTTANFSTCPL